MKLLELSLKSYLEQLTITCTELDMLEGSNVGNRRFHKSAMSLLIYALNCDVSNYFINLRKMIKWVIVATEKAIARQALEGELYQVICDNELYMGEQGLHRQRMIYEGILKYFSCPELCDIITRPEWLNYRDQSTRELRTFASENV